MMTSPDPLNRPEHAHSRTGNRGAGIMVLAGEPSGDVHASSLIREILKARPTARISAMGGPSMASAGADIFYSIEKLSVMGLTEVLFQIKHIKAAFWAFKRQLAQNRPDLIVLVDFPGFNLRAAAYAKKHYNVKVLYYITPKVWAWNQGRLKTIRKYVDHAALIFPFEEKLYRRAGICATYVGNPLMDHAPDPGSRMPSPGPAKDEILIGLLPGSRKTEVEALLNPMLLAAEMIHAKNNHCRFQVSCAQALPVEKIRSMVSGHTHGGIFSLIKGHPRKIFRDADLLIAASGTVTLEAALWGVPTIIVYKMSPMTYWIARVLVRVKYAGLANIITNEEIMPELLQADVVPDRISAKAMEMLENLDWHANRLLLVPRLLGRSGCSRRAAKIALDLTGK